MPLYNMTADGDLYEASVDESDGSGVERSVEEVDDVDASGWAEMGAGLGIDNPYVTAEQIRSREMSEAAAHQAQMDNRAEQAAMRKAQARKLQEYRRHQEEARHEEMKLASMGQDPLLAMAVAQQMSGADFEQLSLSGHGTSAVGNYDHDQTMGFDFSWDNIASQLQSAAESATKIVANSSEKLFQQAMNEITGQPVQAATAPAPVSSPVPSPTRALKSMSPQTKKLLMYGGAAVLAALVLPKLLKK